MMRAVFCVGPALLRSSRLAAVPVPPLDPTQPPSRPMRALTAFALTDAGRWFGITVASRIDPFLMRISRGRVSSFAAARVVLLTARGAKTGQPRTCPLLYFTQGDEVVLIASSFGRDRDPAWYLNVRAHPEVELRAGGRGGRYVAREAEGEERRRLFGLAERLYPGYGDYAQRTAAIGRTIPVMVLRPVPDGPA